MPFFIWSDGKLLQYKPNSFTKGYGNFCLLILDEGKTSTELQKFEHDTVIKTETAAADREMRGEREELLVWLKKSREQLERGEDEKADWCTPGHSSAGTRHRSQNFYSHLKNTLRRRNANNETSAFHVRAERGSEGEREKNHYYSMRSKSPNVSSSKATSCSEPGLGKKKKKKKKKGSSDIPVYVCGDEQKN